MLHKRKVSINVLPGESVDGTGRVCIHLFVQDERGPIVEPYVLHPVYEDGVLVKGKLVARPTRGRLACNPKRTVAPVTRNGVTIITPRTDEPRAVSCSKCKMSKEYNEMMERLSVEKK